MLTGNSQPRLYLDYGADAQICAEGDLEISERGMRFSSRWNFAIGTQLSVALVQMHPRLGLCRMALEGTVVRCERCDRHSYESTLLFCELPDELRPRLREFSHRLAAE